MSVGDVSVTRGGGRLSIVLDRPHARNAVSPAMLEQLADAVAQAAADRVAVVTIGGAGGAFCAGADIASYVGAADRIPELERYTRSARELCRAIETLDAVVIAAVDGPCLGGGFELALACDLIVATTTARLGLPEGRLGLIPGWGGTQRLTEAIGPRRARDLVLGARILDAPEAMRLGIVTRVVEPSALEDAVDALADELLDLAPLALAGAKRAILAAGGAEWPSTGDERETAELMALFATADAAEGIAAFLDKRRPRFVGA